MARIRLKIGENEIEVDSRDFYVDNQTLSETIKSLSVHLPENRAKVAYETSSQGPESRHAQYNLECLDDAEVFEPEFSEPIHIKETEIRTKLRILETSKFFDLPRTVTEAVQQLREYGWAASPLDVSKTLARMASNKEIMKSSSDDRTRYFVEEQIIA